MGLVELPFDIIFIICKYIDIPSIVKLGAVSKRLLREIGGSRQIWLSAVEELIHKEHIAPHSVAMDTLDCASLRRCATRPFRLCATLLNEDIAEFREMQFTLDYGEAPVNRGWAWKHQSPILLPGGRWLINYAFDFVDIHLFCWDLSMILPEYPSLEPVASIQLDTFDWEIISWTAQSSPGPHSYAILFVKVADDSDARLLLWEVIELKWGESSNVAPHFSVAARVEKAFPPLANDLSGDQIKLFGEYVLCVTPRLVYIWNWRINSWGAIDTVGTEVMDFDEDLGNSDGWIQDSAIFVLLKKAAGILVFPIPALNGVNEPPIIHSLTPTAHSFPVAFDDPLYSSHSVIGDCKPPPGHIHQVRIHTRRQSAWSRASLFVDAVGGLGYLPLPRILCGGGIFPLHSNSRAQYFFSDIFITASIKLEHSPDGAFLPIRIYSRRHSGIAHRMLQTGIMCNKRHEALFNSAPCALSGTIMINEKFADSPRQPRQAAFTLLIFD